MGVCFGKIAPGSWGCNAASSSPQRLQIETASRWLFALLLAPHAPSTVTVMYSLTEPWPRSAARFILSS